MSEIKYGKGSFVTVFSKYHSKFEHPALTHQANLAAGSSAERRVITIDFMIADGKVPNLSPEAIAKCIKRVGDAAESVGALPVHSRTVKALHDIRCDIADREEYADKPEAIDSGTLVISPDAGFDSGTLVITPEDMKKPSDVLDDGF